MIKVVIAEDKEPVKGRAPALDRAPGPGPGSSQVSRAVSTSAVDIGTAQRSAA